MRAIVERCDNHGEDDQVPGRTRLVNLGAGPREVEVCEDCWHTLSVAELEKLVYEFGRDISSEDTDAKKKLRCPWCIHSLASPRNWRDHVDTKHPDEARLFVEALLNRRQKSGSAAEQVSVEQASKSALKELTAVEQPKRKQTRRSESRTCEHCGQVCGSPQGLGAHLRSAHGIEGSSQSTMALRRKKGEAGG